MADGHRVGRNIVGCVETIKGIIDLPSQRPGVQLVEVSLGSAREKL